VRLNGLPASAIRLVVFDKIISQEDKHWQEVGIGAR